MRFRLLWLTLLFFCNACGCQNMGEPQAAQTATRIIIGFDETVNSPDTKLTASLGRELGCELQPLQTLGGHAYVYSCATAATEEVLTQKLDGLGQYKGVRYAEIDRKRRIQN